MRHLAVMSLLSSAWVLLAQADVGPIVDGFGHLGIAGVLVWYLYFTNTTTLPKLTKTFRDEAKEQREHNTENLASILAELRDERAERVEGRRELMELRLQCERRGRS